MKRHVLGLGLLALFSALLGSCGGTKEEPATIAKLPHGVAKGADLSRCTIAGKKNKKLVLARALGAPDANIQRVFEFDPDSKQAVRSLRCRMIDTNWDGISDVIRGYNDKGEPLEEQADTDYDGQIDTWLRFSRGRVIREVHDRSRDGKPDENRIYSAGKLSRVQRDRNGDGRLDTWEVYDGDRLHRVGVDLDGDQRVDRWYRDEELKRRERLAEAASVSSSDPAGPPAGAPAAAPPDPPAGASPGKGPAPGPAPAGSQVAPPTPGGNLKAPPSPAAAASASVATTPKSAPSTP
jgi:hypothetical protein